MWNIAKKIEERKMAKRAEYDRRCDEGIPGMRGYWEIIDDLNSTPYGIYSPKKMRALHKELRPYGNGVPFLLRHPYAIHGAVLLFVVAIVAIVILFI